MSFRPKKRPALLFGEGRKEVVFFNFLLKTDKFKFLEKEWNFETGHASGSSCEQVLRMCIQVKNDEREYEKVICFIDTDKLQHDFPESYVEKKQELEELAATEEVIIHWQEIDHESELHRATAGKIGQKSGMKRRLELHKDALLRSAFVKKIFRYFYSS